MRPLSACSIAMTLMLAPLGGTTPALAATAAEDGQWLMPARDFAGTRFSPLAQINSGNATTLHPVWTFSTGVLAGHEGQPLVVGDTMYVVTPWPNVLYAFDLRKEGYPLRWKYRPDVSANAIGVSCCDTVNRGAFYADGKIIYNLLDGHTVAVDAKTGKRAVEDADRRRRQRRDRDHGAAGRQGSGHRRRLGRRVRHLRLDQGTGSQDRGGGLDRHNIGPDADMLAKPGDFKPPYDQRRRPGRAQLAR